MSGLGEILEENSRLRDTVRERDAQLVAHTAQLVIQAEQLATQAEQLCRFG